MQNLVDAPVALPQILGNRALFFQCCTDGLLSRPCTGGNLSPVARKCDTIQKGLTDERCYCYRG